MHALLRAAALAVLVLAVNAHFQLQFPPPRGPFVEDDEPTFCDGYTAGPANRTEFPLSGGIFTLHSEHPTWTAGINATTSANATSFNDFNQPIVPFFRLNGEGDFCIPLNFSEASPGLTAGQNVTIQVVFNGGDGNLYQCADLTLSSRTDLVQGVSCVNTTAGSSSGTASASTQTGTTTPTPKPSAAGNNLHFNILFGTFALFLTSLSVF